MTHLSREALVLWRDHPSEDARATVVAHLAVCNQCAAFYAELVRTRPLEEEAVPSRFDPAEFKARGLALRRGAAPRPGRRWLIMTLAAAAIVVLAVFAVQRRPPDESPVTRGAAGLQVVAPVGAVDRLAELTWTAPGSSDTFLVEILDASGGLLHEARVRGRQSFVMPPDVRARLQPGVEYRWMVSRLDARGERVESSPLATFRIAK